MPTEDTEIVSRIHRLVEQEHELERSHTGLELSADEQAKLRQIEETLDQCWDLLRQRRARRECGQKTWWKATASKASRRWTTLGKPAKARARSTAFQLSLLTSNCSRASGGTWTMSRSR